MPDCNQSDSRRASSGAPSRRGPGAMGFRLRLKQELPAGPVALRPGFTGKLPFLSPVNVSN